MKILKKVSLKNSMPRHMIMKLLKPKTRKVLYKQRIMMHDESYMMILMTMDFLSETMWARRKWDVFKGSK